MGDQEQLEEIMEEVTDLAGIGHDPEAFDRFYRRHVEAVGRFIARRVSDPHTVADLTAEVFIAIIGSAHTYRPDRGSILGWVYGVARKVVASEYRRQTRERDVVRRVAGRRTLCPEDIACIEERIDAEQQARRTYAALAGLPEESRQLIELIAVDGLSVADAAAVLGLSPLVARVRLHRVRKFLRAAVTEPQTAFA
jgi:RNA polymerase sigma factor (sigma-70 family)